MNHPRTRDQAQRDSLRHGLELDRRILAFEKGDLAIYPIIPAASAPQPPGLFSFASELTRSHAGLLQREREYQEAMAGLPVHKPTEDDINWMAAIDDEKRSEGRRHFNTREQRHE